MAAAFLINELKMSELPFYKSRQRFVTTLCEGFCSQQLREPGYEDFEQIMKRCAKVKQPRTLGSLHFSKGKLHHAALMKHF